MASIVIKGSVTPAVGILKRGEVANVQLTDRVKLLIARGYIVEVKDSKLSGVDTGPAATPEPAPAPPAPTETPVTAPGEATPIQGTDQTVPEVANPDVDNSLVDVSDSGTDAPAPTARTTKSR